MLCHGCLGLFPCGGGGGGGGGRAGLLPHFREDGQPRDHLEHLACVYWGLRVIRTAAESPSEKFKGGILWLEMSVCDSRI